TLEDFGEYRTDYSWRMITPPTVAEVLKRTFGIPYLQPYTIDKKTGVTATLYPAGHILGSSQVLISSPQHNILFSGDLGRIAGTPFLKGPVFPKGVNIDTLVLESTYGERLHKQSYTDALNQILELQKGAKGDCLVMTIAYQKGPENLVTMLKEGTRNISYFGRTLDDFRHLFLKYGGDVFRELGSTRLQHGYALPSHLGTPGSRELICAPSGMGYGWSNDAARQMAGNKDSRVIITNFLPEHCPGHKLVHEKKLRTELGEIVPFKGEVFHVAGTSGHGDQRDLVEAAVRSVRLGVKTIVLNHGGEQREVLDLAIRARLQKEGLSQPKILIPQNGDQIDLLTGKIGHNLLHK
ncbi:MAG: MBL fold metallo-hydrolase, partial [Candidatus Absconditabacterales bacterium]